MTLRDKHVFITGGSSGIGLALAQRCAASGAKVSLVARGEARLGAARAAILAATPNAAVAVATADVAVESEVLRAITVAKHTHGPIDILVTSAGTVRPGKFEELPMGIFKQAMAVNYFGTLYAVKALVPAMRQRRSGALVLISSGAGLTGLFGYSAYAPSKFALRGLAESLRAELQGSGVQVSIVYPPDTDTPQLAEENLTKPVETKALTAGAGLWTADAVARVTLDGLERGSFAITPGLPLTALYWFQSLVAPLLNAHFDRVAARARESAAADKPGR